MASSTEYENQPAHQTEALDIAGKLEELRADLVRITAQVQDYVEARAVNLRDSAAEANENVESLIREHPLPAVGLALGAGFVLGLLVRGGQHDTQAIPRLTRRDIDRLASRLTHSLTSAANGAREITAEVGDKAFLERLAGALSGLLESSKETVASVGSAGARSVAAMGEKTARTIANRLSAASR